ncbi:MAG: hypothetical protein A3E00_04420 [Curvibacter sp. RIFCSPHIGHO2_12_FULL_63_18]|uniref:hypothetical protein n=1 Tax=Rhodoferax sp. TaxID=50421 RepID=UPI0008BDF477|nr:hypothetical protein [Rhodoferax sp.]OGO95993.1 MAG: hypothetical protein A2037_13035 [Curvibacter sp. GWA2_63_95]OGP06625.1 MAG: hypothetical protein A3E00_04420 [Curvibacter sp. RIFCSPHIGHO2_12_FULL_63_18]HCX81756.1 hypothetical protein [Rhodoferax sp.]
MASTAIRTPHFAPAQQPNVAQALRDLLVSARTLSSALWAAAFQRQTVSPVELDEASQLRALADDAMAKDPNFAQDLYALADRVERAALAGQTV